VIIVVSGDSMRVPLAFEKSHLLADVDIQDVASAMAEWSWLLGSSWSPILVSAAGDVFLTDSTGAVARLDTGVGALEPVAETREEFEAALDDPSTVADWFLEPVVNELRSEGKQLDRGQCYGFTILPIFQQGSYEASNRFCLTATEHIRVTGAMHLQLKDMADGETVQIEVRD
jgi:hypothetical protein